MFLARALELQVRARKRGTTDRLAGYFGGGAAILVAAHSIGGAFLVPGWTLAAFLFLMSGKAGFDWWNTWKENKELQLDHESLNSYLCRATRDRFENGVAVAIQNRKAAATLVGSTGASLSSEDRQWLKDSVNFWGQRIHRLSKELSAPRKDDVWKNQADMSTRLRNWIDAELKARPMSDDERVEGSPDTGVPDEG